MTKEKSETTPKAPKAPKAPKKAAAEKTEKVYIQFDGREWEADALVEAARADYVAQGHRASYIRDLRLSIKPQDGKAYYTINDKATGSVEL